MESNNKDVILVSKKRLSNVLVTGLLFFIVPIIYRVIDPSGQLSDRLNDFSRLNPNPMATTGVMLILTYSYIRCASATKNE